MIKIAFPGIGINEFSVNPVAFTIPIFGGIEVRWYGIIITVGIILAFTYCAYRAKQEGISFDDVLDIAIFTVIFAILGARTYYVLTSLKDYDSFYDVIAIWEGGLAIYGAIIAGAITIFVVCRHKKISCLKMLDAVAPGVMIGQILGRWGNFFNGEAYGSEVAEGSLFYFIRMGLIPNIESASKMHYFHPTFLYESVWNLIGFLIINALYKKKKFDGQVVLMYLTWYGFGRMLIEGLRTDSLYVGVFRISQVVGLLCFVIGTVLLIYFSFKTRRATLTAMEYTPAYSKITGVAPAMPANAPADNSANESDDKDGKKENDENAGGDGDGEGEKNTPDPADDPKSPENEPDEKEISDKLNNLFDDRSDV